MRSRHASRDAATKKIARHLLKEGVSMTSVRQLAVVAGISDRMLLYYFADKSEVLLEAMQHLLHALEEKLEERLSRHPPDAGGNPYLWFVDMARDPEIEPFIKLWLEVVIRSLRNDRFYKPIASEVGRRFIAWLSMVLDQTGANEISPETLLVLVYGVTMVRGYRETYHADIARDTLIAALTAQ